MIQKILGGVFLYLMLFGKEKEDRWLSKFKFQIVMTILNNDDWATVEALARHLPRRVGKLAKFGELMATGGLSALVAPPLYQEDALAIIARLRADSHAKTEALERITKLTGYWAQVGQVAQRVAHEALGTSPIVAAPKEPYQTGEGMTDVEFYGR